MSFFRHREIFRSDVIRSVRERLHRRPRPHRLDEFPVGYSSAGCSPTEPASASPTDPHSALQSSCRSSVFHRTASSVLTACLSSGGHPNLMSDALTSHRMNALIQPQPNSAMVEADSTSSAYCRFLRCRDICPYSRRYVDVPAHTWHPGQPENGACGMGNCRTSQAFAQCPSVQVQTMTLGPYRKCSGARIPSGA